MITALLDNVPSDRSCEPVWAFWRFTMERVIGTLPKLITSQSKPHVSLVNSISARYKSEVNATFGETYAPSDWSEATGVKPPIGQREFQFPAAEDRDFLFLTPSCKPSFLDGGELQGMRAVLEAEDVLNVPDDIRGKKYFRVRLGNGMVAGSRAAGPDDPRRRRRSIFVRVRSTDLTEGADGHVSEVNVLVFGLAHRYMASFVDTGPKAFAYI